MSVVIIMPDREVDARLLAENLRRRCPAERFFVWPECGDDKEVTTVVAWRHPADSLPRFSNLRLLVSFGAGVDHLIGDPSIPEGVAVVRTVADGLARDLAEYVVAVVARHRRVLAEYAVDQGDRRWRPMPYLRRFSALVLGAGSMGGETARVLSAVGYDVQGWGARTSLRADGVNKLVGRAELDKALPEADAVVCLLPLTPETENILDAGFFGQMKQGSLLVNVGRGGHLVEDDLLRALASGRPGHAVLDVTRTEPLPSEHPFWDHPHITLTPHIAALTDPEAAADHIAENLRRLQANEALLDVVDLDRGY